MGSQLLPYSIFEIKDKFCENVKCVTKWSDAIKNLIKLYEICQESRGFIHERFKHLFLVTNLQAVCVYIQQMCMNGLFGQLLIIKVKYRLK